MKAGILIIFGNIDFSINNDILPPKQEAIINEIEDARVVLCKNDHNKSFAKNRTAEKILRAMDNEENEILLKNHAEEECKKYNYPSYIIPQYYTGKIIWKK